MGFHPENQNFNNTNNFVPNPCVLSESELNHT